MNGIDDENQKIIEIKEVLSELPTEHSQNIAALFKILCKVEALSEHNKMTIDNLIVVVGPNLLWDDSKVQTCKQCEAMCGIEREYNMILREGTYYKCVWASIYVCYLDI